MEVQSERDATRGREEQKRPKTRLVERERPFILEDGGNDVHGGLVGSRRRGLHALEEVQEEREAVQLGRERTRAEGEVSSRERKEPVETHNFDQIERLSYDNLIRASRSKRSELALNPT